MEQLEQWRILDEIALAVVTLDPADAATLARLTESFTTLEEQFHADAGTEARQLAAECVALAAGLQKKGARARDKKITKIAEAVSRLQALAKAFSPAERAQPFVQKPEPEPQKAVAPSERPATRFELPDWVDEAVFLEFLSHQKGVLEEFEGQILALETEGSTACAALKRTLHTLKGEAGILALERLEKACHAAEEFLAKPGDAQAGVDQLLRFRDWIAQALEAYGRREEPPVPIEEVFAAPCGPSPAKPRRAKPSAPAAQERRGSASRKKVERDEETISTFGDFYHESEEGLAQADQILMGVEEGRADKEAVNALFRVFHTIKGIAGYLELDEILQLAHTTETMLNDVRKGTREFAGGVVDLVFDSTGLMRRMMKATCDSFQRGEELSPTPELEPLVARIQAVIAGSTPPAPKEPSPASKEEPVQARPGPGVPHDAKEGQAKIKETVKVDIDRVDSLVEMIGELVIVESMVGNAEEIASITSPRVRNFLSQLGKLTRDLQAVGMRMRMVPVRGVFQKMARMVRDLSRKKGVQIRFEVAGEGTEMDRSMVEQISDPLVHMIRNAVDHGIESADARKVAGKDPMGNITLSAYHEGGGIVIELADDGAGLNKEAILKKALKQGLIAENDTLTENEIHNMIFAPGFSTAKQVTEISGRGVGMDVVRRNVEAMRGRVSISSTPGRGSTFKMVLPLTLAIIEGMLVTCGSERYIIPTLSVIESMVLKRGMAFSFAGTNELINVRGEVLPLVRMSELLEICDAKTELSEGLVVIVEGVGTRFGIFVDDVVTQQQVVIKTLGSGINVTKFVSGAAILSDGRVGLILNVDEIGGLLSAKSNFGLQRVVGPRETVGRALEGAPVETA